MQTDTNILQMKPQSAGLAARVLRILAFPLRKAKSQHDKDLDDVKRLALLSPHLLKDLGFDYDPQTSNPITAVWRKDKIVVQVQRTERQVVVLRDR